MLIGVPKEIKADESRVGPLSASWLMRSTAALKFIFQRSRGRL
jgi:alanine dehydrogenase